MSRRRIPQNTESFEYYNANPKDKITSDCVIRALSVALNKPWDEVMTDLMQYALKYKLMPNDKDCYAKYLKDLGWIKQRQPRKENNTKYTGKEFVKIFKGTCIAHIGGHHLVCIKDGKVLDTWNSTGGCIGNYWVKE